jgi:hypothetical protein
MKIYPSSTELFYSPLLPSELLAIVQQNTSNRVFEWRDEPFRGEIGTDSFAIRRIRWFNNASNRPNVIGRVGALPDGKGSTLELRHYLNPIIFWLNIAIAFLICSFGMLIAVNLVFNNDTNFIVLLLPPGLFFLVLFSIIGPFWQEVRISRELLIKLLLLEKQEIKGLEEIQ